MSEFQTSVPPLLPENIPSLHEANDIFVDFLDKFEPFFESAKVNPSEIDTFLEQCSNNKVTVSFSTEENIEGSFYFTDNITKSSIRFRPFTESSGHVYFKDGDGSEQLYIDGLDPKNNHGIDLATQRINGLNVSKMDDEGITVMYQTEAQQQEQHNQVLAKNSIADEIIKLRKGWISRFMAGAKINKLIEQYERLPDAYSTEEDKYMTQELVTPEISEQIFSEFNRLLTQATEAIDNLEVTQ